MYPCLLLSTFLRSTQIFLFLFFFGFLLRIGLFSLDSYASSVQSRAVYYIYVRLLWYLLIYSEHLFYLFYVFMLHNPSLCYIILLYKITKEGAIMLIIKRITLYSFLLKFEKGLIPMWYRVQGSGLLPFLLLQSSWGHTGILCHLSSELLRMEMTALSPFHMTLLHSGRR